MISDSSSLLLIQKQFNDRNYQEALVNLNNFLKVTPNHLEALILRGRVKDKLNDLEGALIDLNASFVIMPDNMEVLKVRGPVKRLLDDFPGALEDFNAYLKESPNDASMLAERGEVHRRLYIQHKEETDHLHAAIADFDASLAICPNYQFALNCRGSAKFQLGDISGALVDFDAVLATWPDDAWALLQRLEILDKRGDTKESMNMLMQTFSADVQSKLIVISDDEINNLEETPLGSGSYGTVYRALWNNKEVAVKTSSKLLSFGIEIDCLASLKHPNIVQLYGISLTKQRYSLVLELMVKGSLHDLLRTHQELPWKFKLSIARDIVRGLCYLHEQGVVHCDLKSCNILLDGELNAKIADFGISKKTGSVLKSHHRGTLRHMAPELLLSTSKCSPASDVYSLGVILWEILSHKSPFKKMSDDQIKNAICSGKREDFPSTTPPSMAALISHCWAQRALDRPSIRAVEEEMSHITLESVDNCSITPT